MQNTLIALLGSGEYMPVMNEVDRHLLDSSPAVGRRPAKVACLPTAAGLEGEESWGRWNRLGVDHFKNLGADVVGLPVIDTESANDPANAVILEQSDLVYFSGGNPHYLFETLHGSLVWQAAGKAFASGAIYAGCSAGAMILGEHMPEFRSMSLRKKHGFGWLRGAVILPHFDQLARWRGIATPMIQVGLGEGDYALGIDEDTALVGQVGKIWQVMGRQMVYVITRKEVKTFRAGDVVTLPAT